jgi:hypothetical protein
MPSSSSVSEETGVGFHLSSGSIQRNFDPESFKRRLGELLLAPKRMKKLASLVSHHWQAKLISLVLTCSSGP